MKEATYVAISTQKGGAGKTTLTVLVASYLHYVKGYNVAVVDCDFPQYSIHDMRKRDMKAVMEDGHYKVMAYEQLKRLKKNPYTIRCSRAEDAVKTAENLVAAQPDLDFVFFDLPGTINNPEVVHTLSHMDYIIAPISADLLRAVDHALYGEGYAGDLDPEDVASTILRMGHTLTKKAMELALAKKTQRWRATAIVIFQNTRRRRGSDRAA